VVQRPQGASPPDPFATDRALQGPPAGPERAGRRRRAPHPLLHGLAGACQLPDAPLDAPGRRRGHRGEPSRLKPAERIPRLLKPVLV